MSLRARANEIQFVFHQRFVTPHSDWKSWEKSLRVSFGMREMENNWKSFNFSIGKLNLDSCVRMRWGKKVKRGMSLKCEIWWFRHFITHIFYFRVSWLMTHAEKRSFFVWRWWNMKKNKKGCDISASTKSCLTSPWLFFNNLLLTESYDITRVSHRTLNKINTAT